MNREGGSLVSLALERIAHLDSDEAREDALRTLGSVLAGQDALSDAAEGAFDRVLALSVALGSAETRTRAFSDACDSVACSRMPRERRVATLERAIELADRENASSERIDRVRAATLALMDVRHDESIAERLVELARRAAALDDDEARTRRLCDVALALAKAGECERAISELDQLAPSARRARTLSLVAAELFATGQAGEAAALLDSTIGEIRGEPESFDQALALRSVLATLIETGLEIEGGDAVRRALDAVDALSDVGLRKHALIGAIEVLPVAPHSPERFTEIQELVSASIDRMDETYTRAPLLGELAVALASRGDEESAERALKKVVAIASSVYPRDLVDTLGDPGTALPVARILSALADAENPELFRTVAVRSLGLVRPIDEPATIAAIVRQCAQLFASPALPYDSRIGLLENALWVAQAISAPDQCIEAVTAIANALSLAGATERGDGLFSGLVIGIDPRFARKANLDRAIALNRLGRTADARMRLLVADELPGADTWHAIEELAQACARCGFIADTITVLGRVDYTRQSDARMQIADIFAESHYLDPDLRVIGLESVAKGAHPDAADAIACIITQVRLIEHLGEPSEVLMPALDRISKMERRGTARLLEQQLVGALLERLRRGVG